MSEANPHLRRVKEDFANHGIRNEVQIAEYVAYLLLIQTHWDQILRSSALEVESLLQHLYREWEIRSPRLRIPQPPPVQQWGREPLALVQGLQIAFGASPYNQSWGDFFQREIRVELLKGSGGSQYPTPSHIADFMAALALSDLSHAHVNVFDPTAGSGGLLTAASRVSHAIRLTGCDFDPQWAAIGSANLLLHDLEQATYHVGSAFDYAHSYENHFNAVLMNPPFGGSRSADEIFYTVGSQYGRSNATVLTALALQVLQPGGYMTVLVPSGVLFASGGEAFLRQALLNNHLEAIVTLPGDAFQPYSQITAHLLTVHKTPDRTPPDQPIWFVILNHDGYAIGASRDLTQEPNESQNELPRAHDLILHTRRNTWVSRLTIEGHGELQTVHLGTETLPGVGIRWLGDAKPNWQIVHLTDGVLVKLNDEHERPQGWIYEPYESGENYRYHTAEARSITWQELIPASSWNEALAETWVADSEDVTVSLAQGESPTLTLKRARTNYSFTNNGEQTAMACLLSRQGEPLTPWLKLTEANAYQALTTEKFGPDWGAVAIEQANGTLAGWLLELHTANENDGNEPEETTYLFIVLAVQANLYVLANGNGVTGLLNEGWIQWRTQATRRLIVETGVSIKLRLDMQINGLALGPDPGISQGVGYRLFGVLVPRSEFIADNGVVGDLRPSRFFPEPKAAALAHPQAVLASIRKNQTKLANRVDHLLQVLGQPSNLSEDVERAADLPAWLTEMLSEEQRAFWQLLSQQTINGKPRHFNIADAVGWCEQAQLAYGKEEVKQQIVLLTQMGLVQSVHTKGHNRYRLVIDRDVEALSEI